VSEGGREEGGRTGRRTRRTRRSGYRTKNKNPTRQCGEISIVAMDQDEKTKKCI